MGSLKLQSVRKAFGDFEAIKGIDLDIADGEFVVFVGPSGCGKSTLLNLLGLLEPRDAGEIWLDDVCVSRLSRRAQCGIARAKIATAIRVSR